MSAELRRALSRRDTIKALAGLAAGTCLLAPRCSSCRLLPE
jgi:hypothetical protein